MAAVKKAAKKAAKKRTSKKVDISKLDSLTGHDPRNGQVEMKPEKKGFRVTNDRTEYSEFFKTRVQAIAAYNHQINCSHTQ